MMSGPQDRILVMRPPKIPDIPAEERTPLVEVLLAIIHQQQEMIDYLQEKVHLQQEQIQSLKDEIARLKGQMDSRRAHHQQTCRFQRRTEGGA